MVRSKIKFSSKVFEFSTSAIKKNSKFISIGYILADEGLDVWFGNNRGNRYSLNHTTLNPFGTSKERSRYWSFSWHEIGVLDLPAMIDYVLAETEQTKLQYIGHSQGTTAFFVMTAQHPEYNHKIGENDYFPFVFKRFNFLFHFYALFSVVLN